MQVHFTENKGRKIGLTEAGVCLIRGPLNTGFTVLSLRSLSCHNSLTVRHF